MKNSGKKIDNIAVVNENTDYGTSVSASILDAAKTANINVAAHIAYNANSSDVSAQVLQLKSANPDAVIFISYTADSILYFKTMKNLDYLPPIIIGDDAGFSDPSFIPNVGDLAQGALNRSAFDIGKPGTNSYIVDQMFKAKYGRDLDDTSARWMQGFFVLADAINRAGSTDPEKIQAALKATDLKADQLMIGYHGVKFDDTGQNTLASTFLIQLKGKQYVSVWPADRATGKLRIADEGLALPAQCGAGSGVMRCFALRTGARPCAWRPRSEPLAQQPYPTRAIHIVVPFPAGGPSDVMARMIGERMSADFGQAVVVDNRPGANTLIGAQFVAKAAPDGYTLLMAIDSTLVMNQYLYSQPALRPDQGFRADHAGRQDHGAARRQCGERHQDRERSDRQSQGAARQAQLRRRHDHHQAHLRFVQPESRHRDRAVTL